MNTGKQINAMVVVLFLTLIAVGAYTIWDPFRSESAEDEQTEKTANFGAETFERNCRICHGDRGEGGAAGGRLTAAVPLDREELQGIQDGVFVQAAYDEAFRLVTNTIRCGRAGTAMPVWGDDQGGTLNEEQIRQLAVLITLGRWDLAQEHADHTDAEATEHAEIEMDGGLPADATQLTVSNAGPFSLGQYIRIGEERLRVLPNALIVERGVDGTTPADHDLGTPLLLDGEPIRRNQTPVLRGDDVVFQGGAVEGLAEGIDDEATMLAVGSTEGISVGDSLQIDDETVRVTEVLTGLPSTGQFLIEDIGREPDEFFVSGATGLEEGALIRMARESFEIEEVRERPSEIELDQDVAADATRISVNDPSFFRPGYQFALGDEVLESVAAVETGQLLDATIGRAQTVLEFSGTEGIEEGMLLRIDQELMRVEDIIREARVRVERAQSETVAVDQPGGIEFLRIADVEEGEEPPPVEELQTGQVLLEDVGAAGDTLILSGITRINLEEEYQLGDERVLVVETAPAIVRVSRAVDDSELQEHSRRAPVFAGNLIQVERGVDGTSASAHAEGDILSFTELEVRRSIDGTKPQEHAKQTEMFLGHDLNIARGVLDTEVADHEDGEEVLNFPEAPGSPASTGTTCGQYPRATEGPGGPTPTVPAGAVTVAVELDEFSVVADPESVVPGSVTFQAENAGTIIHNLRVIQTDEEPDALPLDGPVVDESAVTVVASTPDFGAGETESASATLEPGSYVLICNFPGHYDLGMYTGFTVQ
jgi:mono/diheme cytochrome c family protein